MKTDSDIPAAKAGESSAAPGKRPGWFGRILRIALPLGISVGLCWALLRDIDFNRMMDIVMNQCDFRFIALMLALSVVPGVIRALRWRIQLQAIGCRPPVHIVIYAIFGTYAINVLFPRLGEVWRSGYIAYRQHSPFSEVFGSMVADRLSDTIAVGLIFLFTLLVAHGPIEDFIQTYPAAYQAIERMLTSPWLWGSLAVVIGGIWATLHFGHSQRVLKVRKFFRGLWDGFVGIFRMQGKLKWLIYTILIWLLYFFQMYVAFYAFPFTRELLAEHGMLVVLVCYVLTSISMGVPSQGGIGPYQATMIFGLRIFAPAAAVATVAGATEFRTSAAAFGNLLIAAQTAFFIISGIIVFILIAIDKHSHPGGAKN